MDPDHIQALQGLIRSYCVSQGLSLGNVSVAINTERTTRGLDHVVLHADESLLKVLDSKASVLWDDWAERNLDFSDPNKRGISNILKRRFRGESEEHGGKMFFLVSMVDADVLRLYMMGRVKLKLIKQWLATLDLTLGMSFPSDIHRRFTPPD